MHPVNQKSSSGDSLTYKAGGEDGHLPADLGPAARQPRPGLRGGAALDRATQTSRGQPQEPRRCQGGFLPLAEVPESRESGPTRLSMQSWLPQSQPILTSVVLGLRKFQYHLLRVKVIMHFGEALFL